MKYNQIKPKLVIIDSMKLICHKTKPNQNCLK